MTELVPVVILLLSLWSGALYLLLRKNWERRLGALERELQQFSDAMCQMAEMQLKSHQKLSTNLGDIEERILDLAVPSPDAAFPLERRHQVLALANQGMAIDQIVDRVNVPRGEAELILGLRKYMDSAPRVLSEPLMR
jgi:hypothetical protein